MAVRCFCYEKLGPAKVRHGGRDVTYAVVIFTLMVLYAFGREFTRARHLPQIAHHAANPMLIAILFLGIQIVDFAYLAQDPYANLRGFPVRPTAGEVLLATVYYASFSVLFLAGVLTGMTKARPKRRRSSDPGRLLAINRYAITLVAITSAIIGVIVFLTAYGFTFDIAELSAEKSVASEQMRFLPILLWMAFLSFGMFLCLTNTNLFSLTILTIAAACLAAFTGSRTHIFVVLIFYLFALSRRRVPIPPFVLFVSLLPVFVALTLYRFFFRATAWYAGGFGDFVYDRGGALGIIFGSDEVSTGEIFSHSLFHIAPNVLTRWPFEGLTGLLMSPISRDIAHFKPLPFSTEFSMHVAPSIWFESKSQLVTGPFLEWHFEFSLLGLAVTFSVGLIFGALLKHISVRSDMPRVWFAVATVGMFTLLRTDVQTWAVFLIPFVAVYVLWRVARALIGPWVAPAYRASRMARTNGDLMRRSPQRQP